MRRLRLIDSAGERPEQEEEGHMKVAFATNDLKRVDAHFGGAKQMVFYDISEESSRLIEAVQFDNTSAEDGSHAGDDNDDRLGPKIDALKGCSLLFVLAIGGPAAARVIGLKIHPIKLPAIEAIPDVISRVQGMLKGNPPPWLRKVLLDDKHKMDFLEEEDA
ncbi:nitrogen fixation protein NifX [Telmatospirillum sp.]|uniref:nitrogen fixation protein NifX n=1 Tax=Telmatospirillum sp. TaxID=2079197 RepID=UPI002841B2F6|nr:nitrogen fixation protein NifX [Telmatospirillum sp.]MDR3437081.1 nitrogen fixation protein NifX [Telmatospirillum sp.]